MNDNTQDRSQSQGQQGIDKDTERRNRENETGQQGQQSPSGQDRGEGFQKEAGQAVERSETDLATEDTDRQETTGLGSSADTGGQSGTGFVGTSKEDSSDYLTKGEEGQDFAKEGQVAQDTSASKTDIETGQSTNRDPSLDDGSSGER